MVHRLAVPFVWPAVVFETEGGVEVDVELFVKPTTNTTTIIIIIIIINTAHVECKNKGDTSNNRGDWDYFKVI